MRLLFVCTGNTCRSPMAEQIAKQKVKERGLNWQVRSAGLFASAGMPMADHAVTVLERRQIHASHRSKSVTEKMLDGADIVLTMTEAHRQDLVRRFPQAADKTHALLRFIADDDLGQTGDGAGGSIAGSDGDSAGGGGSAMLFGSAGQSSGQYDIVDPIGGPEAAYQACADRLDSAIDDLLNRLEAQQEIDRLHKPRGES